MQNKTCNYYYKHQRFFLFLVHFMVRDIRRESHKMDFSIAIKRILQQKNPT